MKVDFAKDTRRIVTANFTNSLIRSFLPFLRKTVFMWVMGAEYLGLNGLFYSILGMLSLAELGFAEAIVSYMYKPVADDDHDMECSYLCFFRNVYRLVGAFIFITGLCLLPFLRRLIHGSLPPDVNLHVLYLAFLTNTALGYLFFSYRSSILSAHNRKDISTYISAVTFIIEILSSSLVIFLTHNYYFYIATLITCTILSNLAMYAATRIYFPDIVPRGKLPKEAVSRIFKDIKAIIMHRFSGVITASIGNVVTSAFLGLSMLASYGNYSHISNSLGGFVSSICYSMQGGFGNKIHTESREDTFKLLMKANRLLMCLILWCTIILLALYQPFMILWTRGDVNLVRHFLTPLLMVIGFYEKQSRETLRMVKNAAALWQPDKWKGIVAGIVNITLSITFAKFLPEGYKLDGIIAAVILSDIFIQMPWEAYAIFTNVFDKTQCHEYCKQQIRFFFPVLLVSALTLGCTCVIPIEGMIGFFVKAFVATAIASTFVLIFFRENALEIAKSVLHRKKR